MIELGWPWRKLAIVLIIEGALSFFKSIMASSLHGQPSLHYFSNGQDPLHYLIMGKPPALFEASPTACISMMARSPYHLHTASSLHFVSDGQAPLHYSKPAPCYIMSIWPIPFIQIMARPVALHYSNNGIIASPFIFM